MRFEIRHRILYRYSQPVFVDPLEVQLRPRSDVHQTLIQFDWEVSPVPVGRTEILNREGNNAAVFWFEGVHESLEIVASSVVETHLLNPFDFVITDPSKRNLPCPALPDPWEEWSEYLTLKQPLCDVLQEWVSEALDNSAGETIGFLTAFCRLIHERLHHENRTTGAPRPPTETLELGRGACRDFALVFMDGCRSVGLPTRFVSGYQAVYEEFPEAHLHAWVEVFLPGGGWRGFDPTSGLATADRHVALASGASSISAAPTFGVFRGTGVRSEMEFSLSITVK